MGKKRLTAGVCALVMLLAILLPSVGQAQSEIERLSQEINELERAQRELASEKSAIENQIKNVQSQRQGLQQDIMAIDLQIAETETKLQRLGEQIKETTSEAEIAAQELEEAKIRVAERDELLKTRLRLMYKFGDTSYLEVLLGATSFGDFLQRFKALKLIIDSDVKILEKQKQDRDLIAAKKAEIDKHLVALEGLFTESELLKAQLNEQRKSKTVAIASLQEKEGELEEIKQEQEEKMLQIAAEKAQKYNQRQKLYYQGGPFHWPVPGYYNLSSGFGVRKDPFTGVLSGHKGMDIPAPAGTNIVAAESGIVILASYVNGYGYTVIIDHGGGMRTLYAHGISNGFQVKEGQEVLRGQAIHKVGSTGRSTGNHLHFEVRKNDVPIDPQQFFQ